MAKEKPLYVFNHEGILIKETTILAASEWLGISHRAIRAALLRESCVNAKYYFSRDSVLKIAHKQKDHNFYSQQANRQAQSYKPIDLYFRNDEVNDY